MHDILQYFESKQPGKKTDDHADDDAREVFDMGQVKGFENVRSQDRRQ